MNSNYDLELRLSVTPSYASWLKLWNLLWQIKPGDGRQRKQEVAALKFTRLDNFAAPYRSRFIGVGLII